MSNPSTAQVAGQNSFYLAIPSGQPSPHRNAELWLCALESSSTSVLPPSSVLSLALSLESQMAPPKVWPHQCRRQGCSVSWALLSAWLSLSNSLEPACEYPLVPASNIYPSRRHTGTDLALPHSQSLPARGTKSDRCDWTFKVRLSWVMLILQRQAFPNNRICGKLASSLPYHLYSCWPKFEWHARGQTSRRSQTCGGCSFAVCIVCLLTSSMCEELKECTYSLWKSDFLGALLSFPSRNLETKQITDLWRWDVACLSGHGKKKACGEVQSSEH